MFLDSISYLPNDILVKTDRASMYHSLEVRTPFLNSKLINNAWSLPIENKIHKNNGKIYLRNLLKEYLPEELFSRPKHGFSAPISKWLKSSLRDWGEDLIRDNSKYSEYLNQDIIYKKWQDHQRGIKNWDQSLWTVLIFIDWINKHG